MVGKRKLPLWASQRSINKTGGMARNCADMPPKDSAYIARAGHLKTWPLETVRPSGE